MAIKIICGLVFLACILIALAMQYKLNNTSEFELSHQIEIVLLSDVLSDADAYDGKELYIICHPGHSGAISGPALFSSKQNNTNGSDGRSIPFVLTKIDPEREILASWSTTEANLSTNLAIVHGIFYANGYFDVGDVGDKDIQKITESGMNSYVMIKQLDYISDVLRAKEK